MPQPRKEFTKAQIKKIASGYKKGRTLADLGAEYDVSASTVRNRLIAEGVPMRPRGKQAA